MSRPPLRVLLVTALLGCGSPPGRPPASAGGAGEASEPRVAVVDLERVLAETPQGQEAMAEFRSLGERLQAHLDELREHLHELQTHIEAAREQGGSEEALSGLLAEYQRAAANADQAHASSQQQLQAARAQITRPLLEDVSRIVRRIGRDEGFDLIVDRTGIGWAAAEVDITQRVVMAYGEEASEADAAAPQPPASLQLPSTLAPGSAPAPGQDPEPGQDEGIGE